MKEIQDAAAWLTYVNPVSGSSWTLPKVESIRQHLTPLPRNASYVDGAIDVFAKR